MAAAALAVLLPLLLAATSEAGPRRARKPPSQSIGLPYEGRLRHPAALPPSGLGFELSPRCRHRFGTDDLVAGLKELAQALKRNDPASAPLKICALSAPWGGPLEEHRSHQNGRDADLAFFWRDDGRLDVERNWALVRALLESPRLGGRIAYLFVRREIRAVLLRHGAARGESPTLLNRAAAALKPPSEPVGGHDDHFHLRIACSKLEKRLGCRD